MRRAGSGLSLVLVLVAGLAGEATAADIGNNARELEARRLSVEAVRLIREPPCGAVKLLAAFFDFAPKAEDTKAYARCLDRLAQAAAIYDRVLTDYPETEVSFAAAQTAVLWQADVKVLREMLKTRIAAARGKRSRTRSEGLVDRSETVAEGDAGAI